MGGDYLIKTPKCQWGTSKITGVQFVYTVVKGSLYIDVDLSIYLSI